MSFKRDEKIEMAGYNEVIKPFLISQGITSVFLHYSNNKLIQELQKRDIDIIIEVNNETRFISLKVVQGLYDNIFCETVSNDKTKSPGWLTYSDAEEMYYLMREGNEFRLLIFYVKTLRELFIKNEALYPIAYGENKGYTTTGVLIPISDFGDQLIDTGIGELKYEQTAEV